MLDTAHEAREAPDDVRSEWDEPRDRPFNPWRCLKTDAARAIVADGIAAVEDEERRAGRRQRKRRVHDQANFEAAVAAILSDAIHHAIDGHAGSLSVTRSRSQLTGACRYRPAFIGKTFPDILDTLASAGLIDQEVATSDPEKRTGRQTVLRAGWRLREWIRDLGIALEDLTETRNGRETIILKRTKEDRWDKGGRLDYVDTETIRTLRAEMAEINAWIGAANLDAGLTRDRIGTVDLEDRTLCRHFTLGRFDRGGRLFGGFWQRMSKEERRGGILIDEEEAVELDYGQVCPRIVYGLCHSVPPRADLYDIPGLEGRRDGVKKVMNAMLFTDRRLTQMPRGTRKLFPDHEPVEEVVAAIEAAHPQIRDAFFRGIGHAVQFAESTILVEVLLELKASGIVALPIHDAVMVPRSRAEETRAVMLETFERLTGVEGAVELIS